MAYHAQATSEENAQLVTNLAQSVSAPRLPQSPLFANDVNLFANQPLMSANVAGFHHTGMIPSYGTAVPSHHTVNFTPVPTQPSSQNQFTQRQHQYQQPQYQHQPQPQPTQSVNTATSMNMQPHLR